MQSDLFFKQANGILDSKAKLKQVKVVVCAETCTFIGHTHCMSHQRLLDILNQDFMSNSIPIGKDFMALTDAEVLFPDREREYIASIYVRKAGILFIAEKSDHQTEKPEVEDKPRIYLAKPKSSLEAEIHMPLYTLTGQIYGQALQKLLDVIDRADRFLPLTHVEIRPALYNAASTFDFVAVNREKIIYVCEALSWAKAALPAAEAIRQS